MPHLLGITGNIACGKSTIGAMLLQLGADDYIDADQIVHEMYLPGAETYTAVTEHFGQEIIAADGAIDRQKLGAIVFSDPQKLAQLEKLTHATVEQVIGKRVAALQDEQIAVIDAVKLLEGGLSHMCEAVWIIACDISVEMERLIRIRGLTQQEAAQRITAQPDRSLQKSLVDVVIDNSGDLSITHQQVANAWRRFLQRIGSVS